MRSNNVIAKGKYRYPQKAGLVTVNNYIIVKENGKKYLLLRFFNERNEVIDRLAIKLVQYDSAGKVISSAHKTIDDIGGVGGSQFVPECKIELEDDCADFRANIISAEYGRYSYSPVNSGLRVDYVNEEEVQPFDAAAVQKRWAAKTSAFQSAISGSRLLSACSPWCLRRACLCSYSCTSTTSKTRQTHFLWTTWNTLF